MIYDVYRVGKAISNITNSKIEPLFQPDNLKDINYVIWLKFKQEEDEVSFAGIEILDYIVENSDKYLLRKASPNGANYGPSAQVTEVDKTLNKKIAAWFKEAGIETNDKFYKTIFTKIYNIISDNEKSIIETINDKLPKGKNIKNIISVKLNNQYPLEVSMFFEYYTKKIMSKIVGKDNHIGTCCLCGKKNTSLLPKVDVFKFYTVDKPGFISGGFSEEDIWRNCPVCISCEPILREGKRYMLEQLKFRFFGFEYYLIPSSTCSEDIQEILVDKLENISHKSLSLREEVDDEYTSLSGDMFEELSMSEDINSYRIIFFKIEKSAERIYLDMKDIFPSRFATLYSAKYCVEKIYFELIKERFSFQYFRKFLSKSDPTSKNFDLNTNFLALTHAIFTNKKILFNTLLPHYMRNIRHAFLNDEYMYHTTLRAWIGIKYLQEIGCINFIKGDNCMDEKLEKVLEPYDIGLDTKIKKALVLVGALTQKVMNIQAKELNGSTSFSERLKGLKMRNTDVEGLVSDAVNKMIEYDSYSKPSKSIVATISELIFMSPTNWGLSTDEINFYVAGGMALSNKIYEGLKEE